MYLLERERFGFQKFGETLSNNDGGFVSCRHNYNIHILHYFIVRNNVNTFQAPCTRFVTYPKSVRNQTKASRFLIILERHAAETVIAFQFRRRKCTYEENIVLNGRKKRNLKYKNVGIPNNTKNSN